MSHFDMINSLPASLSCNILRDWLNLKSVVALDSACCCKASRVVFEEMLQSNEYFVREKITFSKNNTRFRLKKFGSKLRSIALNHNKLSKVEACAVAFHCRNLTYLTYFGNGYITGLAGILRNNSKIEYLGLSFLSTGSNYFAELTRGLSLPNLTRLALTGSYVEHAHIIEVLQLSSNITHLNLASSNLDVSTLLQLPRLCPQLTSLGISNTLLSDDDISQFTALSPHIKQLDIEYISYLDGITDAGILAIVQNLTGLQSLNMRDNDNYTHISLVHIYTYCANTLHTLRLDGNYSLGEKFIISMNELLERCRHLHTLHLHYYHNNVFFDTQLILPATTLSNMNELIISGDIVCDHNLTAIGDYGINLHTLGVLDAHKCSESALIAVYQGCPKLREFYIHLTPNENSDQSDLATVMRNRPGLVPRDSLPLHLLQFDVLS